MSLTPTNILEFGAIFDDLIWYYIDGEAWAFQKAADFGCPGEPKGKDMPRGLTFKGWAPITDYEPYNERECYP